MGGGESYTASYDVVTISNTDPIHEVAYVFGLIILCSLGFFAKFGAALDQESDSLAILGTILRLELSRADVLAIEGNKQRLLVRNNTALQHHLEAQGWTWTDQMGALSTYHQTSQVMYANCAMYSRFYMICNLDLAIKD
jgi:hypothetical protein